MQAKTNKPKSRGTAWRLACIVAILAWMPYATVCAQSSKSEYERALEDSLILYVALKPAYQSLKISHNYTNQANVALRHEKAMYLDRDRIKDEEYQKALDKLLRELQRAKFWGNVKTAGAVALTIILSVQP